LAEGRENDISVKARRGINQKEMAAHGERKYGINQIFSFAPQCRKKWRHRRENRNINGVINGNQWRKHQKYHQKMARKRKINENENK